MFAANGWIRNGFRIFNGADGTVLEQHNEVAMSGRTVQHRFDGDIHEDPVTVQAELDVLGMLREAQISCARRDSTAKFSPEGTHNDGQAMLRAEP